MRRAGLLVLAATLLVVGPAFGAKPARPKSSVTITGGPDPVVYGSRITIRGQAVGKDRAGAPVALYARLAPTYQNVMKVARTKTDATGHYSFRTVTGVNAVYFVIAETAPPATSGNALVGVRVKLKLGVSTRRPARGARVRFFGLMSPAYNGRFVLIQRKTHTGWKTVAAARLVAAKPVRTIFGPAFRSKYSRRVRIDKSGIYRVFFDPRDGLRIANTASRRLIVH